MYVCIHIYKYITHWRETSAQDKRPAAAAFRPGHPSQAADALGAPKGKHQHLRIM